MKFTKISFLREKFMKSPKIFISIFMMIFLISLIIFLSIWMGTNQSSQNNLELSFTPFVEKVKEDETRQIKSYLTNRTEDLSNKEINSFGLPIADFYFQNL